MKAAPAIRGRMGSTTYYETKLSARELTSTVRPARESDKWASASIEERLQRDLNLTRIRDELMPYLAKHHDRFWGSLIVLVPADTLEFEPLTDVVGKLPGAYRSAVESMGFITVERGEHIALDGQHRLQALKDVISAGAEIGPEQSKVGDDEMSVLVIEFESAQKTRRIFNKVNRHAKPTGRADNILLSEDDGYAIVARMLLDSDRENPPAPLVERESDGETIELVNWRSNTLTGGSRQVTTISAVYETVIDILRYHGYENWEEKKLQCRPPDEQLDKAYAVAAETWQLMLSQLTPFVDALSDLKRVPALRDDNEDPRTLLLRPVGQIAFVKGVVLAMERARGKLSLQDALKRGDLIDWSATATSIFRDSILTAGGRMVARKEAYRLAAELIAYLVGAEYMDDEQRRNLWREWNAARGKLVDEPLDGIVEDELKPEGLPEPCR